MGGQPDYSSGTKIRSKSFIANSTNNASKVVPITENLSRKGLQHVASGDHMLMGRGIAGEAALFLLKVAALETVRRFSKAKCPFAWRGLQGLQVVCYPPLKWIQRWAPFKALVNGMQMVSQPLLAISVATALSDPSGQRNTLDNLSDSDLNPRSGPESSPTESPANRRTTDEAAEQVPSEYWLVKLLKDLDNEGISLPERLDKKELKRFYNAANGDLSCLLSSIKKTIRWRETYEILTQEELENWSELVYWHGYDVRHQPCLIIHLGLACSRLSYQDRSRFAQAIVSQMEHGILRVVDEENARVTVLVDCAGLSPLRVPMKMLRSCSLIFQDHFPNRLACLFVIRLPRVVRVIAQTFFQVLKPVTRQKLKIIGERYQDALSEYLQILPAYLGGRCMCLKCSRLNVPSTLHNGIEAARERQLVTDKMHADNFPPINQGSEIATNLGHSGNQVLRTAFVGILMFWIFVAFIAGRQDPESRSF